MVYIELLKISYGVIDLSVYGQVTFKSFYVHCYYIDISNI